MHSQGALSLKAFSQNVEGLMSHLSRFKPETFNVVLMPDFFLDRFISWNGNARHFSRRISEVVNRKGGSIDNVAQMETRGGNAVNTAEALASLGMNVFPIVHTSELGFKLLELGLQQLDIDLSYVKVNGTISLTTALEFTQGREKKNVMLRDLGSLEKFGPNNLTKEDFSLLEKTNYVCVFNWAGTRRHGTALAETVFYHVKTEGRGKTYYDTADPLPNKPKIPELVEKVLLRSDLVDILSVNENEVITFAEYVAPKRLAKLQEQCKSMSALAKECAKILAQRFTSRIDLHATTYSATFTKNESTVIPAFNVKALRATGSGDAWNAGNIYADANDFPVDLRLMFANAVAAYYISGPTGEHPQVSQLHNFLKRTLSQSNR